MEEGDVKFTNGVVNLFGVRDKELNEPWDWKRHDVKL